MFSIGEGGGAESTPETKGELLQSQRKSWSSITGLWVCASTLERGIYEFTLKLAMHEAGIFKLKYYPQPDYAPGLFRIRFRFFLADQIRNRWINDPFAKATFICSFSIFP